jgi:hypothetical protein
VGNGISGRKFLGHKKAPAFPGRGVKGRARFRFLDYAPVGLGAINRGVR